MRKERSRHRSSQRESFTISRAVENRSPLSKAHTETSQSKPEQEKENPLGMGNVAWQWQEAERCKGQEARATSRGSTDMTLFLWRETQGSTDKTLFLWRETQSWPSPGQWTQDQHFLASHYQTQHEVMKHLRHCCYCGFLAYFHLFQDKFSSRDPSWPWTHHSPHILCSQSVLTAKCHYSRLMT